jgi:hypothetical protein
MSLPGDLVKALREELDVHSAITQTRVQREGVDAHFNCRYVTLDDVGHIGNASDFWKQESYVDPSLGYITLPSNVHTVGIYSKKAYRYPALRAIMALPDLAAFPAGSGVYVGFENGPYADLGIWCFRFYKASDGSERLVVPGGEIFDVTNLVQPLSSYKAPNMHGYAVKVSRSQAEFWIDDRLVAVICYPTPVRRSFAGPPYLVATLENAWGWIASAWTSLIEVNGAGLRVQAPPFRFRVAEGDPCPPRVYRLYEAGTNNLFAGKSVSSGSLTSHPVPVFGYANKALLFRADTGGTIAIEVLTQSGNWRTYSSEPYSANDDYKFIMTGSPVLARVVYTPSAYPATVNEGEVYLS